MFVLREGGRSRVLASIKVAAMQLIQEYYMPPILTTHKDLLTQIYKAYYHCAADHSQLVSSHWKNLLPEVTAEMDSNAAITLHGVGFGDLEHASWSYRFFSWLTIASYLCTLKNRRDIWKVLRMARGVLKRMGRPLTYDGFRQICSLALIQNRLPETGPRNVLCIGDGYGLMAALIKEAYPQAKLFLVDLGKVLLFQAHHCSKAHPNREHLFVNDARKAGEANADFFYVPAEKLSSLEGITFDLAINIASMQEMNMDTVRGYFNFLRRHLAPKNLFYCCNRIEKKMEGGEVSSSFSYPWSEGDEFFADEMCPWYRYFLARWTLPQGPRIGRWRVPCVNYFEGDIYHRLSCLRVEGR